MLLKSWLSTLGRRVKIPPRRPRPRRQDGVVSTMAAEIQVLEARDLLSGAALQPSPVTGTMTAIDVPGSIGTQHRRSL